MAKTEHPKFEKIKTLLNFECPSTMLRSKVRSTCSSLSISASFIFDHASVEKSLPWHNLASRILSPISTLCSLGISDRIPEMSATLPHPLFLRSSMLSLAPPVAAMMSPRYLTEDTSFKLLLCTFNFGQGNLHFFVLPMWITVIQPGER